HRLSTNLYVAYRSTEYNLTFCLPSKVKWPFKLAGARPPKKRRLLNGRYLPARTLKADVKGVVMKAFDLKKWFNIKYVIIKEGKSGACADDNGMDIRDRLRWQKLIYTNLRKITPLPDVIDFFEDGDNAFLVLEFVDAESVRSFIDA